MSLKNFEDHVEHLRDMNPDALLANGFEEALVGIGRRFNSPYVAVYDYNKCLHVLMERDSMSLTYAIDFMEYNVVGAWMGESTPIFIESRMET